MNEKDACLANDQVIPEDIKNELSQSNKIHDTGKEKNYFSYYDLQNDSLDEEVIFENCVTYNKSQKLVPNFSIEWIDSLKMKLTQIYGLSK